MKSFKLSLLLLATLFGTLSHAQTSDEIVNKHIEAIGGKDKLNGIKSVYTEGSISIMGNDAPSTTTILNGKGFKSEIDFNGQKIVQAITDKGGWMINPMIGSTDPQAIPEDQYKASKEQIFIGGPLMDYAAKGIKVALAGKENVGTVNAYKLNVTTKDSSESTLYIDPATYYIIKAVRKFNMNGQEGEVAMTFSDFKKTDYGYVIPYTTETTLPQGITMTSTIKKAEVNKEVDPKVFEMPK